MNTIIIGIAGGTGSGKTTLTEKLREHFGSNEVSVINHDSYYKRHDELPYEERCKLNYDHPDSFDTALMIAHLRELRAGHPVQVEQKRSIADALVAQTPGDVCFPYVAANTDGFAAVADDATLRGMKLLLLEGKLLCEPSSAIGMGAALRGQLPVRRGDKVCFVISGGSVALEQLHQLEDVAL
mgnify:CR=1 FL=1